MKLLFFHTIIVCIYLNVDCGKVVVKQHLKLFQLKLCYLRRSVGAWRAVAFTQARHGVHLSWRSSCVTEARKRHPTSCHREHSTHVHLITNILDSEHRWI